MGAYLATALIVRTKVFICAAHPARSRAISARRASFWTLRRAISVASWSLWPRTKAFSLCARIGSAFRSSDAIQSRPQPSGQLLGIIVGPEVHEEQPGLVLEHVVVDGRDLDPVRAPSL